VPRLLSGLVLLLMAAVSAADKAVFSVEESVVISGVRIGRSSKVYQQGIATGCAYSGETLIA